MSTLKYEILDIIFNYRVNSDLIVSKHKTKCLSAINSSRRVVSNNQLEFKYRFIRQYGFWGLLASENFQKGEFFRFLLGYWLNNGVRKRPPLDVICFTWAGVDATWNFGTRIPNSWRIPIETYSCKSK